MRCRHPHNTVSLIAVFAAISLVAGCENSIEPFAETTRHFAIYGFLDADADTQFVRIEATRPNPDNNDPADSDIDRVTTRNLVDGEAVAWRDSIIQLDDGSTSLLYWAEFSPVAGEPYRIEVVRSDGATSSATTTTPDVRAVDVRQPERTNAGTFEQALIFDQIARRPEAITLNYDLAFTPGGEPLRITLDYNVFGAPWDDGWKIDVRFTRDRERIETRLGLSPGHILYLREVSMEMRLLSTDWPLVGSNQRVNNVVEGFGFFGSAATHLVTWRVDSLVVGALGFRDEQGGPPTDG